MVVNQAKEHLEELLKEYLTAVEAVETQGNHNDS